MTSRSEYTRIEKYLASAKAALVCELVAASGGDGAVADRVERVMAAVRQSLIDAGVYRCDAKVPPTVEEAKTEFARQVVLALCAGAGDEEIVLSPITDLWEIAALVADVGVTRGFIAARIGEVPKLCP